MGKGYTLETVVADVVHDPVLPTAVIGLLRERSGALTAESTAQRLGLPSRFVLAHQLQATRALPFREIREWVLVDEAVQCWEQDRLTPCECALADEKDPSTFYDLVQRLTGRPWIEVRRLGSAWLMAQFAERCRRRFAAARGGGGGTGGGDCRVSSAAHTPLPHPPHRIHHRPVHPLHHGHRFVRDLGLGEPSAQVATGRLFAA